MDPTCRSFAKSKKEERSGNGASGTSDIDGAPRGSGERAGCEGIKVERDSSGERDALTRNFLRSHFGIPTFYFLSYFCVCYHHLSRDALAKAASAKAIPGFAVSDRGKK